MFDCIASCIPNLFIHNSDSLTNSLFDVESFAFDISYVNAFYLFQSSKRLMNHHWTSSFQCDIFNRLIPFFSPRVGEFLKESKIIEYFNDSSVWFKGRYTWEKCQLKNECKAIMVWRECDIGFKCIEKNETKNSDRVYSSANLLSITTRDWTQRSFSKTSFIVYTFINRITRI